jgi:hypothetical protein
MTSVCTGAVSPLISGTRLSAVELEAVDQALRKGPHALGFDTELWTLARIAAVIQQLTGVRYHPGHCGGCCADSAGAPSGPPAARPSVTRPRSPAGAPRSGPGSRER